MATYRICYIKGLENYGATYERDVYGISIRKTSSKYVRIGGSNLTYYPTGSDKVSIRIGMASSLVSDIYIQWRDYNSQQGTNPPPYIYRIIKSVEPSGYFEVIDNYRLKLLKSNMSDYENMTFTLHTLFEDDNSNDYNIASKKIIKQTIGNAIVSKIVINKQQVYPSSKTPPPYWDETSLAGTMWMFKDTISIPTSFSSINVNFYLAEERLYKSLYISSAYLMGEDNVSSDYNAILYNFAVNEWSYLEKIILFDSGAGVTDSDLISWMKANATLISVTYTISATITNGTATGDTSITEGRTVTINIKPNSGCLYPTTVTVSGATSSYNSTTGVVSLSNPTSNVTISATCVPQTFTITTSVTNGTYSGDSSLTYSFSGSVTLTASSGYGLPSSVTVNQQTGTSGSTGVTWTYNSTTGVISLSNPTTNITISAICLEQLAAPEIELGE